MRIVFLGSAEFGIPALRALQQRHTIAGVVRTPPRPCGRGLQLKDSPVAVFARQEKVTPLFAPESLDDPLFIESLRSLDADCFVVVAFRLLPRLVFAIPPLGTLNIHASLLPSYRGPAPIQRAIEAGATTTGITVFRIDDGIDTGEILQQAAVAVGSEETTPELAHRLSELGADTLCAVLAALERGDIRPSPQQHAVASRAPKLKKHEAVIDWKLPASFIFNKIRAFKPFPGTYTLIEGKRLGIEWALPLPQSGTTAPCGTVLRTTPEYFEVQTGAGVIRVLSVKPQGRRILQAGEYLHGARLREGLRFDE
ncbi:MAG: methionyl-tRNA formyltransferase [Chitinispirillaceae bacterium]|nr:methionyl-tRNA formyltransferase [Chitinispirillaceae bacterium]